MPWGVRISPFVFAHSGRPFNITTGVDSNLDSRFNERPTYAQLAQRCNTLGLTNSFCDVSGVSNLDEIIPRNYGAGPKSFTVNLRLNKTIGFGKSPERRQTAENRNPRAGQIAGVRGRGRRGGGRRGGFFGGSGRKPYNLTLGVSFRNLLNTVNLSNPIGNLNSSRFGQSVSSSGGFGGFRGGGGSSANRRVDLQMRFSF